MIEELTDFHHYAKLFIGLFAMVDTLAATTTFLALSTGYSAKERANIAAVASGTMLVVFFVFLVFGNAVLDFFGISQGAFMVMGGVVLFLMALDMIRDTDTPEPDAEHQAKLKPWIGVAMTPLAVPLLAGPGAISTVVVFAQAEGSVAHQVVMGLVVLAVVGLTYVSLSMSKNIGRLLGPNGISIFNKIMGMIVMAITIEFVFDGTAMHFPDLTMGHD